MPVLVPNSHAVQRVPVQEVYVNGVLDTTLVCESVDITKQGAIATFHATALRLQTDKYTEFTNPITVWVNGDILFRGYVDHGLSDYRTGRVKLVAKSPMAWLRDRSVNLRPEYTAYDNDTGRSFAITHEQTFAALDTYISEPTPFLYQIWDVVDYFRAISFDDFWNAAVTFQYDGNITPLEPIEQTIKRFEYNAGVVEPVEHTVLRSPLADQVFRMATWGQVMDYLQESFANIVFVEAFTASDTFIIATLVGSGGVVAGYMGYDRIDFRTLGANVMELKVDSGADLINRVAAFGSRAGCAVTVMSETASEVGYLDGLVPDWPLFDNTQDDVTPEGLHGAAAYDYETDTYSTETAKYQMVSRILTDPTAAETVPGYEYVGRRWRLPNWFNTMEFQNAGDVFTDPKSGAAVAFQVFIEQPLDDANGPLYNWCLDADATFDPKTRIVTTSKAFTHPKIKYDDLTELYYLDETEWKLARVALTFTFLHPQYTMLADTYLSGGELVDDTRRNAIDSGVALVYERPDFGYLQMTNIDMPLSVNYREKVPTTDLERSEHNNRVFQEPVSGTLPTIEYAPFVAGVIVGPDQESFDVTMAYTDTGAAKFPATRAVPTEPEILRDDMPLLWDSAVRAYAVHAVRPRAFQIEFPYPYTSANISQRVLLSGVQSDFDVVAAVRFDLRTGFTTIETTNRPSEAVVRQAVTV